MSTIINLSVVIPVFNEELCLESVVKKTLIDLKSITGGKYEIILVDDGSNDQSRRIINDLKKKYQTIESVFHKTNHGIGAAIYSGIKKAKYPYVTYLPADGQVYLTDFKSALEAIPRIDLVITFRKQKFDYSFYRRLISKGLILSMRLLFGLPFRDYTWVHVYRKSIFQKIKPQSTGVFFLPEVILLAVRNHLRIIEKESDYRSRISGKSKNIRLTVVIESIKDLLLCLRRKITYK